MYGYIYKITDLKNNKIYIGQHKSNNFEDDYWGSGNIIRRILKKDGKKRLRRELLCECDTRDDLNYKEQYYIALYNSRDPEVGYNLHKGGTAPGPLSDPETARINMSVSHLGNTNAAGNADMIWIHKDGIQTKVHPDEYESYIYSGWIKGMLGHSEEDLIKTRQKYADGIYINNGIKTKHIPLKDLSVYLSQGWVEGKLPYSSERNAKLKKSKSGTICITDGKKNFFIKPENWNLYENKGYYKCSLAVYNKKVK